MTPKGKTLVLGGGPTSLASAVRIAEAGAAVKVIERLPWTGGLSKSFKRGPFLLDLGPHRWTPHNKEVNDFVAKLLDNKIDVVRYQAEIMVANRFIGYPFRIGDFLTKIPPTLSVKLISYYLLALILNRGGSEITYEEWVMNHFGKGVTELILRPLIEKVWGTPLRGLTERFARQRIAIANLWEIVWELITGQRAKQFRSEFFPDNHFLYPSEGGFGRIVDRMEEEIVKHGGEVEINSTVKEIHVANNRVSKVVYEKEGKTISEENPAFVLTTIPIQYFFEIVRPQPAPAVLEAAKKLKTRRLILLYVVIKKDKFSKNTSMYFPSAEFPYGRMWEQKNHSAVTIPTPGKTVIGLEIPCWETDPIWKEDDAAIFERGAAPLIKHGLLKREDVEEFFTVKLGSVYPVWDVDFEKNLEVLLNYERSIENLLFNGRPGRFFYNNLHHSLDMGFIAARHVLSGLPKAQKWDVDADVFKSFQLVE